ncbi:MAG: chromosomal replication initiator protein DnaA [Anaerolineae bacterium]
MNARDAWSATLGQLRVQLNRSTYDTWLRHAELLGCEDGRFVVTVPDAYVKDWIERHLLAAMTQTLARIYRRAAEIQVIVWNPVDDGDDAGGLLFEAILDTTEKKNVVQSQPLTPSPSPTSPQLPRAVGGKGEGAKATPNLNPAYNFDTFIVGDANRYAALLARAIVESPIGKYNPVLFYGGIGMGKTHLLQSIARDLLAKGLIAIYLTAEEFTAEMVSAIRTHEMNAFRSRFRNADAVLIDDLQFIEGKDGTENELMAIWDTLRNRQKAMIMASNCLPRDMPKLSADARSRFQAGPIAAIEKPDYNLRCAILDAKLRTRSIVLADELRHYLAERITGSARELEAAAESIHTFHHLTRQPITGESLQAALPALGASTMTTVATLSDRFESLTVDRVLQVTAQHFRFTIDEIAGRGRSKLIVQARQIAMFLARELTGAALTQIGAAIGGRDHTTVLHGCSKIAKQLSSDPSLDADIRAIRDVLRQTSISAPASTEQPLRKAFDADRIMALAGMAGIAGVAAAGTKRR